MSREGSIAIDGMTYRWRVIAAPEVDFMSFSNRGVTSYDTIEITGDDGSAISFLFYRPGHTHDVAVADWVASNADELAAVRDRLQLMIEAPGHTERVYSRRSAIAF